MRRQVLHVDSLTVLVTVLELVVLAAPSISLVALAAPPVRATAAPPPEPVVTIHMPPEVDGRVLHWVQVSYSRVPSTAHLPHPLIPDPSDGKQVTGQMWEQVGTDGLPEIFHGIYFLPGGTFLQEVVETRTTSLHVFGPSYAALRPPLAGTNVQGWCARGTRIFSSDQMRSLIVPFADTAALSGAGYRPTGNVQPSHQLPSTPSVPFARPTTTYGSDPSLQHWTLQQAISSQFSHQYSEEVGTLGRMQITDAQVIDSQGVVVSQTWNAFGPVQVYNRTQVPDSVFQSSYHQEGGC